MKAIRFGNGDFRLTLTTQELEKLLQLSKTEEVARAKISADSYNPLNEKTISLIYDSTRDRDCGLDCSDMIKNFHSLVIPVYIADRGIERLIEGEPCGSCYGYAKLEIRVE